MQFSISLVVLGLIQHKMFKKRITARNSLVSREISLEEIPTNRLVSKATVLTCVLMLLRVVRVVSHV